MPSIKLTTLLPLIISILATASASAPASAAPITSATAYTGLSSFTAVEEAMGLTPAASPVLATSGSVRYDTSLDSYVFYLAHGSNGYIDLTFTILFSSPIQAFGANWDNLPLDVGTGMVACVDNITCLPGFGVGVPYTDFWGLITSAPFASITFHTTSPFSGHLEEHGTFNSPAWFTPPPTEQPTVPEPKYTYLLLAITAFGLVRLFLWKR